MTRANGSDLNRHSGTNWNSLQTTLRFFPLALVLIPMRYAPASPKETYRSAVDASQSLVDIEHELMIRDLAVVDDPPRTIEPCEPPAFAALPAWSFGALMSKIAAQAGAEDPSEFTLRMLETWDREQTVNGFTVPARENMRPIITNPWLLASGGSTLDLRKAPFRLIAIVNRMDLRRSEGYQPLDAGEARFVFNAVNASCNRINFTMILEFKLRASSPEEVVDWANRWHALGDLPFGATYNEALQGITDDFTKDFAQLRVNDLAINFLEWELRTLVNSAGALVLSPQPNTPDASFNQTTTLASYVNEHAAEILTETHQVPESFLGGYVQASFFWDSLQIEDRFEVRHHFGMQTCNGCHSSETGTRFVHVAPRWQHEVAQLSDFLTGENMPTLDPFDQPRTFNELQRRADLLQQLLGNGYFPAARTNRVH